MLDEQVERMLRHPDADRFYRNYALRWTGLQRLDVPFDEKDTWHRAQRYVEQAMQQEAVAFFREVVENNLSAELFLDSDFAMSNDVMAAYLGYSGKFDATFRRVPLKQMTRAAVYWARLELWHSPETANRPSLVASGWRARSWMTRHPIHP